MTLQKFNTGGDSMSKPYIHAVSSARQFGGVPEDYIKIHNMMDSSKGQIADARHRALTHNAWFIAPDGPLELIFGVTITNADGRKISVRDIGEQHILEDFGNFIPSAQDYLQEIDIQPWMDNGRGVPPSFAKVYDKIRKTGRSRRSPKSDVTTPDQPLPPSSNDVQPRPDETTADFHRRTRGPRSVLLDGTNNPDSEDDDRPTISNMLID
jgi:hypothetical protein